MQWKTKYHRLLALLLALVMLLPVVPVAVFAEAETAEIAAELPTDLDTFETDENITSEATEPPAESPADEPSSDEAAEETPAPDDAPMSEQPVPDDAQAEEPPKPDAEDEPFPYEQPSDELPAPGAETDSLPDEQPSDEQPAPADVETAIAANGHAYVTTLGASDVYSAADRTDRIYAIANGGAVLLATEVVWRNDGSSVKVWFVTGDYEAIVGYVAESTLADTPLTDDEVSVLASTTPAAWTASDAGELVAFVVEGEKVSAVTDPPAEDEEQPASEETEQPAPTEEPLLMESPIPEPSTAQVGDFVAVFTTTRVYPYIDETVADDYDGDDYMGVFVKNAIVQVESVAQDSLGRYWYAGRYLYGDDFADGTLKWTNTDTVYVLASETAETAEQDFTITDYAYPYVPRTYGLLRSASPMNGFSLKTINAPIPSFYVGQSGVYGSSGKDSDYLQIAKSSDHGTIYATPHYLDGFTVYCLEHNLSGPGENISGGGQQPKGPYMIVDIDSYRNNPGYSSIIYHDSTMHAIAWVLRHTYPFMALDRSDSDNETWSRVAGQFAIRQVIRELEGAQYVRSYWNMDNFYRASGQAPAVYLEYARWLAANGIARGRITGNINVSGKSTMASGSGYVGTVTLTTDADLMRVSRSAGSITGNTAGSDGSYYYLNSGDTISVTSSANSFSITVESVSSEDEEASFLVGVPSVEIQKVLIPQYGYPYKLKSVSVKFDVPMGSISVTKKDAQTGVTLAGAVYELLNATSSIVQTQTTGANGVATFANLQPGTYLVREKGAPQGYTVDVNNAQNVTVTAGTVSTASFTNDVMTSKIRIIKKDQLTKQPLAGVEFTVTRLSAPAGRSGIGEVVAVITTDANGTAETGWLDWGRYRVEETKVPPHFVDNHYSTEIDAFEDGKTYPIEVENEPTKGWIRLAKTDRQNGNPIEGVQFDIYYNDEYGKGLAATMVTGKDGIAVSEPLRKGRYIVREHGDTAGYFFEEIVLDATVKSDETTELFATNCHVTVKLKLYKRDADEYNGDDPNASARAKASSKLPEAANISAPAVRGDGVLTGAVFQVLAGENIKNRQGNVVYAKGDVVIESLTTAGEDASVTTGELWPGLYEVVEITPPVGYQPSNKSFFVDARSAAMQSQEAVITYEGLKTNEILYGAFGIVKFTGDNEVHEDAGVIETPEKGAEFEVYLKRAGSYENAREFERDYLTTNKYGRATTKALPYGVYVLRQVVGKEGYAIMRPIDVMIDGTGDLKDPPTLILNNQAIHYRLKIIKTDAETGKTITLAGTAFKIKDADGNYITQRVNYPAPTEMDTFVTNESGEVTLPETVTWGQYFIEEVQSPEGYLLNAEPVEVFVGHTGDTVGEVYEVTVEVPNQPVKGSIAIEKKGLRLTGFETLTDAYGNEYQHPVYEEGYLAGAVFELRAAETITGKDGTVWYEQDALVDTITTTASGADASKLLPLGKYYLIETAAPAGYAFDGSRHEVELAFADTQTPVVVETVAISNDFLSAEISLQKEKETLQPVHGNDGTVAQIIITNDPGEGFVFGLYSGRDILCGEQPLMADTLVATGATGEDGSLTFAGCYPHGEYYIKELSAPDGWKLNPNTFPVTLDPAAKVEDANVIRISLPEAVHDELIYTNITLTKQGITGEKTLPGAQIEVRNDKGEVIYRATTDEHGQIPGIPVTPGRYTFREVLAPAGYSLNEAEMSFTVDANGNVTGDTVIRDDYARFFLQKQDENGQPLAGVEFGLLKEDGTLVLTAVSDAKGVVTFEKVPYGSYRVVETKPLPGYVKSDTKIQVTVDGAFINPDQPLATIVNQRIHIHGIKVDTSGQYLAGVEFSLINADTGVNVETVTSNEKGEFILTRFDYGNWIIREIKAPEGFIPMEDISLHVDESWTEPAVFTCVNIPDHYAFLKTDSDGHPLAGVKFALEDAKGNVLRELVSGEDGVVRVTDLERGDYVIREIEALEGFQKSEETLRFTIDESYVVPDEMPRFINYKEGGVIQTGFEMTMTPMMWAGAAMALAGVLLAARYIMRGKKRKRRRR